MASKPTVEAPAFPADIRKFAAQLTELNGEAAQQSWLEEVLACLKAAPAEERLRALSGLAASIAAQPAASERFRALWENAKAYRLFSEAGLPEATSLLKELLVRLRTRVLPQLHDELDLHAALQSAHVTRDDARWMANAPECEVAGWAPLLGAEADFISAIRLLSLRAASIALSRHVAKLMPSRQEAETCFFALTQAAQRLAANETPETRERLRQCVADCQACVRHAHAAIDQRGVSADWVFRLDLSMAHLNRIQILLRVMSGEFAAAKFAAILVSAVADERGVHVLMRNSVNRIARHVVSHTGKSGEHYIAETPAEWKTMGWGAMGAGAITAFTALFKYALAALPLAPFWTGIAHSLNYTVSFVLMQWLGWKLASKMPSMTAAALSVALQKNDGMVSEVQLVAAITRTQVIVTLGNLLGAVPAAFAVDFVIRLITGSSFLNENAARHGVESLHAWHSLTALYAALTGAFLWLSSLVAGWTQNWMAVHRLPEAIARSRRLQKWAGTREKLARLADRHLSGIAGYACLGLLLGFVPFASVFVGVPIEVRHITLASASLAYDMSSLAWARHWEWRELTWAVLGLCLTGILNFGVSFALGLWLALRACGVELSERLHLFAALGHELRSRPGLFFWRFTSTI